MNSFEFILISMLIAHWVFDFIIQTEKQGLNKSTNNKILFSHVNEYTIGMFLWCFILLYSVTGQLLNSFKCALLFWSITFTCHFITDYFTSRMSSKKYKIQKFYGWNGFWFWIGLDQILHIIQLLITFKWLA